MDHFEYRDGRLFAEEVAVQDIAAEYGTPCYIYSRATIERHWRAFDRALGGHDHLVCYAVKANSNLAVLDLMARLGSGFDIVSAGELERVLAVGGRPENIVFSGVGKTSAEMIRALEVGIGCFNVESEGELERLDRVAGELGRKAPVSLRINPDVDPETHPYIATGLAESKFGIPMEQAERVYRQASEGENLQVIGIDCHIGSQLTRTAPFEAALERLLLLVDGLARHGIELHHLDMGGGVGIRYRDETPPLPEEYGQALLKHLGDRRIKILMEPGRAIVGNAGIFLTRVEYLKTGPEQHFAIVDGAMNDLVRPSLYGAWQDIVPADQTTGGRSGPWDIVGPVCETGDFLGKGRDLNLSPGDLLAVRSAGAYGFAMSSSYNSRPRVAEVMVDGDRHYLVRERETIADLMRGEHCLPGIADL